jgi:hypothetical protein
METPNKAEAKRRPDGKFGAGNNANPLGRPKGKSLKEFWKERFAEMTDTEKIEFAKTVSPELLWQMAEGRPKQDTDVTSGGKELKQVIVQFIDGNSTNNSDTEGISAPVQE